jgi:hypothetical protein
MHLIAVLVLAVGTFLSFPRLARAQVAPGAPSLAQRKAALAASLADRVLTTRRTQAIDDLRLVRYEVQDGPARDACLRIPVDFGQPMPERTLLALEATCHPLAAALRAAYERSQRYRPLDGFPTGEDTLGEALYGPRPVAAHPTGLSPDELSRRYFPTGK